MRGTISLSDIYQRCNMVGFEPADYKDVARDANFVAKRGEDKVLRLKGFVWP